MASPLRGLSGLGFDSKTTNASTKSLTLVEAGRMLKTECSQICPSVGLMLGW